MKPDAYNYSRAKDDRARLLENWQAWLVVLLCVFYVSVYDICLIRTVTVLWFHQIGPRHFAGIGASCLQYIEHVVWRRWPSTPVFLLGMTPLPDWTRTYGSVEVCVVFRIGVIVNCVSGDDGCVES